MDPVSVAVGVGTAAAGALSSAGGRKYDPRKVNRRYQNRRVDGYNTDRDRADAEGLRGRRSATIGAVGSDLRGQATLRHIQRGIAGSPSLERTMGRVAQHQGAMLEDSHAAAEGLLSDRYASNQQFERDKMFTAWGSEIGGEQRNHQQGLMQQSAFWNSINSSIDALSPYLTAGGGGGGYGTTMGQPGYRWPQANGIPK